MQWYISYVFLKEIITVTKAGATEASNFWRNIEVLLINCEIDLVLLVLVQRAATFAITNIKLYVPFVTLSTNDNAKLLQQLKSGFKWTINWDKYRSKTTIQQQNSHNIFFQK